MYKHRRLTRPEFETEYRAYMIANNYTFEDYDVAIEWRYYEKGRSWFAALLDHRWDA